MGARAAAVVIAKFDYEEYGGVDFQLLSIILIFFLSTFKFVYFHHFLIQCILFFRTSFKIKSDGESTEKQKCLK